MQRSFVGFCLTIETRKPFTWRKRMQSGASVAWRAEFGPGTENGGG
ncbi:hypothetical protein NBRC3255_1390 [Gluconobacter thailandicus NBRC 3255]|nr:hypothetical protein NBRC3255_1390 [Gluconobacter thailandicus NBRC 3255]